LRFIKATLVAIALVPLVVAGAVFVRTLWASRSSRERGEPRPIGRPAAVFGVALLLNGVLLFALFRPLDQPLDENSYVAAVKEEAARGEIEKAAALVRIALKEYPNSSSLSALGMSMMVRGRDCDGLRQHLSSPAVVSSQPIARPNLVTLARAVRVCGLSLKGNPGATQLIDALRIRPDLLEELDLLQMELGLTSEMGTDFRRYARVPASPRIREDTLIEGVTTRFDDNGGEQFIIYFRPLADWQGRRLWVHAYPQGTQDYIDIGSDFPAFNGWQKNAVAWEVFQTPDARAFTVYVGVAIGDELGPALLLGVIGGT
jgi:hypothetical protein